MSQSRLSSCMEAVINTGIGFLLSLLVGHIVYPMYGFAQNIQANAEITGIFTVVSLFRSYAIRRWFNHLIHKAAMRLAGEQ